MIHVYHQQYRLSHHDHTTTFDSCPIHCIHLDKLDKEITVHFTSGETAQWQCKWAEPGYLSQFGIAASADGRYVFIQTWENGLFCFCSRTGQILWRTESKRGITNIYANQDTLLCHQHERSLQLLDIHTGKVLQEKRPATAWGFTALDHRYILCQVTAKRWEIINAQTLETVEAFTHKDFTGDHADYCIRDIALSEDGTIEVHGFKNVWDTSVFPAVRLPNLEITNFVKTKIHK
jgi:hypothetical protein